jgi:D-glycero-D-manno-heptose 1,7-bisphosphate phosphatase
MTPRDTTTAIVTHPIDVEGVWCEIRVGARRGGPALFLDRDGVVVEETGYLWKVENIAIVSAAATVIAAANRRDIPVVLVTNQAGIGRGYYGWDDFAAVQYAISSRLEALGAQFDAVYACPHHSAGKGAFLHPDHPARKPNPGMILRAAVDLTLDLHRSWLVGDKTIDIEAAKRGGLAGALLVMTGYGETERARSAALAAANFEVRFGQSIAEAASLPILTTPRQNPFSAMFG